MKKIEKYNPSQLTNPPQEADLATCREHFPFSSVSDDVTTRREFIKVLTLSSGALFTGTAGLAVAATGESPENPAPTKIGEIGQLNVGQALAFAYPTADDPCLLVHRSQGQYVAYSQKCTHLACPVYWEAAHQRLECPCHEGAFDVNSGKVLWGPPQRPLPRIPLVVEGKEIYAVGIDLNLEGGR